MWSCEQWDGAWEARALGARMTRRGQSPGQAPGVSAPAAEQPHRQGPPRQPSSAFLAPGTGFVEDTLHGPGDSFGMIQAHYVYYALYYFIITSAPPQIIRH